MLGISLGIQRPMGGIALWTPSELTTAAWYDAQDASSITHVAGAMSQWNDKSGNAHHLKQSTEADKPTYGTGTEFAGKSVVSSDGGDWMVTDANFTLSANNTIFLVYSQTGSGRRYFLCQGGDSAYIGTQTSNTDFAFIHGGASFSHPNAGNPAMFTAVSASANYEMFFDGTSAYASAVEPNLYDGQTAQLVLNSRNTTVSQFSMAGEFAEIIYFNSTLSQADREKVEGYLAHRWGIEGSLPVAHPYKSSAPTI